jgi:hypothetical protein
MLKVGMRTLAGCAIALALQTDSRAQTVGDEIRTNVKEGQRVSITDDQGREFTGRIEQLSPGELELLSSRAAVKIPYDSIVKIDRPHDGLGNGARWGFFVGAVVGFAALALEDARACEPGVWFDCSDPSAAGYAIVAGITGGLGTAIGVGIDALIHRDPTIYRRGGRRVTVSPAVRRGYVGAVVQASW